MCYYCKDCDAYVGCHNNTKDPLGTMANKELRQLRVAAHKEFDEFWKSGYMKRWEAYRYLQNLMALKEDEAHIGKFTKEQCIELITKLQIK